MELSNVGCPTKPQAQQGHTNAWHSLILTDNGNKCVSTRYFGSIANFILSSRIAT